MKELRGLLNQQISHTLIQLTKAISLRAIHVKILTNIIYTFGNIFVSLSSPHSEGQELYQ